MKLFSPYFYMSKNENSDSKKLINDNAKDLLKNNSKYYVVLIYKSKKMILASNDSKSKVDKEAKDKLIDLFKDKVSALNKFKIYKLNIRKTSKDEIEEDNKNKSFDLVGGKLVMTIQGIIIEVNEDNKIKFIVENQDFALSEKIFFDNKFLKVNNVISENDILKMVSNFRNDKWTAVSVVKLSKYI